MRPRLLLGLVPALPMIVLAGACDTRPVTLGLAMRFPEGLLDQATGVTLSVFDANLARCDAATGVATAIPATAQTFPLDSEGCAPGTSWCKTIALDKDGSTQMFVVVATKAVDIIAEGCATKAIDQDPLEVDIQAHRFNPPACCNDGRLDVGEQCDPGPAGVDPAPALCHGIADGPVCFSDCTAKEILLSVDDQDPPGLKNGAPKTKTHLAMTFGPGGVNNPGMLRAVFTNTDGSALGGADVNESFLAQDLGPIVDPQPLSLQLRMPLLCGDLQGGSILRQQRAPAIAAASDDTVAIVYESDETNAGNFDVVLVPQTADGCTDQKPCAQKSDCQTDCVGGQCASAIVINSIAGGCSDAHVSRGPAITVLVTWARKAGIFGRIWRTDGTVVPATSEISIAGNGAAARVAGNADGFRVVYQAADSGDSDGGVFMRTVSPSGAVGPATLVNTVITAGVQDQPDIAMLDDGTTLVVWHSDGDVYFQRFDAKGAPVKGDQDAPLNTSGIKGAADASDQQHPAAAGASGFFTVAWETIETAGVSARFIGARAGFGFNSVTGQNDEFVATDLAQKGERHNPVVAMGGFTAIGWEDYSADHPGVYVRRFPPPTQ
jgi:hypothetical protein